MKTTIAAFAGLMLATAASANADVISYTDMAPGFTSQAFPIGDFMVDVTASPGGTQLKTVNGVTAMGVAGGNVNGEIDGSEFMVIAFDAPVIVTSLEIAFLYDNNQFGDHPAEIARVVTDISDDLLSVTGHTSADWTGAGSVVNLSPANEQGGGSWRISGDDIFAGPVTYFMLRSGNAGDRAKYADFSFVSASFRAVPTPGSIAMLGAGTLLIARRRRR